jgi:hypothetical protein
MGDSIIKDLAQLAGATDTTNGSWLVSFAGELGVTSPVNGSWWEAIGLDLGLTAVNGSWIQAIAIQYGATDPVNGSWLQALYDNISFTAAPVNTVAPAISGTAQVGSTLTCSQGTWTGTAPITYAYQWKRNGSNISGATNSTYTIQVADGGTTVSCTVTATNSGGSASANATGVAVPVPWSNTYSFLFDGVNERIDIGTTSLGITGAISVSAWVKTTSSGLSKVIVGEDTTSGNDRNWLLAMTSGDKAAFLVWNTNGTLNIVSSVASINDGNWHHVLGVYDGTIGTNKVKL